jgi:restriction endonuclease S subunit
MTAVASKQLRHVLSVTSGATPDSGKPEYWDGDIRWVTPEDVSALDDYWLSETRRRITQDGYDSCGTSLAPRGSIVLTKRAPIGQLAVLAEPACSNQGCFLLTPRAEQDSRYFYYWLATQADRLQVLGRGSTFMELSTDELKALQIPEPPPQQQRAIADYLDRETARIDALIVAKERVLALLAEKRRALITRAVTRGLDPHAPLRDSGIPWLGEIPAHWVVARLKYLATEPLAYGANEAAELDNSSFPRFVRITDIGDDGQLREDTFRSLAPDTAAPYLLRSGDVLFARSGATVGKVFLYKPSWGPACFAGYLIRLRCDVSKLGPEFLYAYAQSEPYWGQLREGTIQATIQNFSAEKYGELSLALPPVEEQRVIVEHITRQSAKLDALRAATERTIALLKERRSALIAAAVTGQIDVGSAA